MTFKPFSINIAGTLHEFHRPAVMGIVNVTPDSFYARSRTMAESTIRDKVAEMLSDGVDIIDIGGYSSRPGAEDVTSQEELHRLTTGMRIIREIAPYIPVSVDTFRAEVAKAAILELGANIINDISGGTADPRMDSTIAGLNVPFIMMHMRGTPTTMQQLTDYDDVSAEVLEFFSRRIERLRLLGVNDIILDPGFGFAKTVDQNYELMARISLISNELNLPLLVGISRKSMIYRPLGITPEESLEGTVALNTIALMSGASIIRVHDVKAARQTVEIVELTRRYTIDTPII